MKKYILLGLLVVIILLLYFYFYINKKIEDMSPKEIMTLYYKSRESGDIETLKKIIIFPSSMTKEAINKKLQHTITSNSEKFVMRATLSSIKVEYGRIIDKNTAEVGVVISGGGIGPFSKRIPSQQIILKKDNGIWKYHHNKYDLTEQQLRDMIKKNPKDADLYYLLGSEIRPENPAKAKRYFRKYYELTPNGFWIDSNMEEKFKGVYDYKKVEEEMLTELAKLPPSANKCTIYKNLGLAVMEGENYEKAKMYFQKAEDEIKKYAGRKGPDTLDTECLAKARKELEMLIKQGSDGAIHER